MPIIPSRLPLVAAPMAGGISTPEFVAAVGAAGAFAFLPAGYRSPAALGVDIAKVRESGVEFGVNLFVPDERPVDAAAVTRYADSLRPEFTAYDLEPGAPVLVDDDGWPEKLELLCSHPVPVVSLTFALPEADAIRRLHRAGSAVLMTVSSAEEARAAVDRGVDGIIVQGFAAGGHSAIWDPARLPAERATADLVAEVRAAVDVPVLGAGGIDSRASADAVRAAGAEAAVAGTLFLRADEAGTSAPHRAALAEAPADATVLTRAYTGRPARGLRTAFIEAHEDAAPVAYPAVHHLTSPLRRAATKAGDRDRIHLWAGTGYANARAVPVAEIVEELAG